MVPRHSAFINAGTELGHFHVGFAPPIRNFARLPTDDLASFAFAMAMRPSSNSSAEMPAFPMQGRFDVADELAVSKGVSYEIPRDGFLQEAIHRRRCGQRPRHKNRRPSVDHLISFNPTTVAGLHACDCRSAAVRAWLAGSCRTGCDGTCAMAVGLSQGVAAFRPSLFQFLRPTHLRCRRAGFAHFWSRKSTRRASIAEPACHGFA